MADKQRKLPKQARSWQRYNHILDTAAQLFETEGVTTVTTNHIADAATVSIGSLYQFFPQKEAIIEALIERYQEALYAVFPQHHSPSKPIEAVIQKVLTSFMTLQQEQVGFQAIMIGIEGTELAYLNTSMQATIIGGIANILTLYYPKLDNTQSKLCATISFSISVGIMSLENLSPEIRLEQMVMAISTYQKAFIKSL
ncbi:MAG: TetR/AcrR family transcriptional regulator [Phototrophicaceae bacterium]